MPELPSPPPALAQPAAGGFDLADLAARSDAPDFRIGRPRCADSRPGEIVVCAPDPERDRLRALPDLPAPPPPGEIALSDSARLGAHVEANTLANGMTSNRVMVDVKIRF
ncbi:hypothetical protein [Novosphingobium album (ex Liu et al. 2023)]|uniref:Uncharacterized protein n=1 Tax=Novosphingobium album (ex Liu et al. 2023) TaxID=3031130 RepID=A0ABT5WSX8_9SPHN|nr:hypothetical protein [Novosphingobium album (ex Liu et al. 2023)]MDE8652949.1 hypothetical protein [Novosphingobium album (ex Liu et al. 2023)]